MAGFLAGLEAPVGVTVLGCVTDTAGGGVVAADEAADGRPALAALELVVMPAANGFGCPVFFLFLGMVRTVS